MVKWRNCKERKVALSCLSVCPSTRNNYAEVRELQQKVRSTQKVLKCGAGEGQRQWCTEGGFKHPLPLKFQSFEKAELNSQFHGKYIRNNLRRIQVR
jgi:hypothetical protein